MAKPDEQETMNDPDDEKTHHALKLAHAQQTFLKILARHLVERMQGSTDKDSK